MGRRGADLLVKRRDLSFMSGGDRFGPGIGKQLEKTFQNLLLPLQELRIMNLVFGGQQGHGLFFPQDFQDDLDL